MVDYVIDGLEEEIRDRVEEIIHQTDQNNNQTKVSEPAVDKFKRLKDILKKMAKSKRYTSNIRLLRILLISVLSLGNEKYFLKFEN